MADLEVLHEGESVEEHEPQNASVDGIDITWTRDSKVEYYALSIENVTTEAIYLYRVNIDREGRGTNVINDRSDFKPGEYLVTIYSQAQYIDPSAGQVPEQSEASLRPVNTISFLVGDGSEVGYESSRVAPKRGRPRARSRTRGDTEPIDQFHQRGRSKIIAPPGTTKGQKYAACLVDVAAHQSPACLEEKAWGKTIGGRECYNPYAVCSASVLRGAPRRAAKSGQREFSAGLYDFDAMDDAELIAFALLHGIRLTGRWNGKRLSNKTWNQLRDDIDDYLRKGEQ